jgi:hypothetical protein
MGFIRRFFGMIFLLLTVCPTYGQNKPYNLSFEFYDDVFNLTIDSTLLLNAPKDLSESFINASYQQLNQGNYKDLLNTLTNYKEKHKLNDWLYYQLVRKAAQEISPKKQSYERYTFYKWFLMVKSGYDARLTIADNRIIFYVYSDDDVSDIPYVTFKNKKYITLNYHDYNSANLNKIPPKGMISDAEATKPFSYKVTMIPDFKPENYIDKKLEFEYGQKVYHFSVKVNPEIETLFANYPVVDFGDYFNIPMSKETYSSLIPVLRKNLKGMNKKKGVDYLMRFTRYAFLYQDDQENSNKEKRRSPEQTLGSAFSDCDDRAALFFYLVKEIYNLPMIALLYPTHITMAVQFDKQIGKAIIYNGRSYSVCEPTPQLENLKIGQLSKTLKSIKYEVVYCYEPTNR